MRRAHGPAVAAAVAAIGGMGALPALAAGAPSAGTTTWPGWELAAPPSDLLTLGQGEQLVRAGTSIVRYAEGGDGESWFVEDGPDGRRAGAMPTGELTAPAADRWFVSGRCALWRSDDRAATWTSTPLSGCDSYLNLAFADRDHGFVTAGSGTWGTDDGGVTWTRRGAGREASGRPLAIDANTMLAITRSTAGYRVERTTDGGGSWATVLLPPPPPPPAPPAETEPAPPEPAPTASTTPVTPSDDASGVPVSVLPALAGLARRADGAVIVGTSGAVLVSRDAGASFERVPLPAVVAARSVSVTEVLCDPVAVTCLVGVDGRSGYALRFGVGGFDAAVLPGLPENPVFLAEGDIFGTSGHDFRLRSVDGGVTYDGWSAGAAVLPTADRTAIALASKDAIQISSDAGTSWTSIPAPPGLNTKSVRRLGRDSGARWLLLVGNRLQRFEAGAWKPVTISPPLDARSFAVVGDALLVVGRRGIVRMAADGTVTPLSAPVLAGRPYTGIEARGRHVVAWSAGQTVRSVDGGRRWHAVRGGGVNDLQLVGARGFVAVDGNRILRSAASGRRTRQVGVAPALLSYAGRSPSTLAFSDASTGIVRTAHGTFLTADGGRRLTPIAFPPAAWEDAARPYRRGVAVGTWDSNVVVRAARIGTRKAPTVTARRAGRVTRRGASSRWVVITGRVRGAVPGARVSFVASRSRRDGGAAKRRVTLNADGTFRVRVPLLARERLVRVWYSGDVTSRATMPGAGSRYVAVPQVRKRSR